jgi:hypothetical protein
LPLTARLEGAPFQSKKTDKLNNKSLDLFNFHSIVAVRGTRIGRRYWNRHSDPSPAFARYPNGNQCTAESLQGLKLEAIRTVLDASEIKSSKLVSFNELEISEIVTT